MVMHIKKVVIDRANRLYQLPPDLLSFVRTEPGKSLLRREDTIDLGSFVWPVKPWTDLEAGPELMLPASFEEVQELKQEIADWYSARHHVRLTPDHEIFIGGGIRQMLLTLALGYIESGDIAFVPEVGMPLYRKVVTGCGGEPISYRLSAKDEWMPDFERVRTRLGRVARFLFLNSPHNPTGTVLGERELTNLAYMAGRENILLINDAAYQSIPSRPAVSLLSVRGGKRVGVEICSFSYLLGLPWLPFGFAAGNREIINGLGQAASLLPVSPPRFLVPWVKRALRNYPSDALRGVRRDLTTAADAANDLLALLECEREDGTGTPFIWARLDERENATVRARTLFQRFRILVAPGTEFGEAGEGYLRFTLLGGSKPFEAAAQRLKKKSRLLKRTKSQ